MDARTNAGGKEKRKLRLERNFEGIFAERALSAIDVRIFGHHDGVAAFRERGGFGDGHGLRGASRDAIASEAIRGGESPGAVREDANPESNGFGLRERADLAIFRGEVALAKMHDAHVSVRSTAKLGGVECRGGQIVHVPGLSPLGSTFHS